VKSQVVPSHEVWLAPFGLGQALHNFPHELVLLMSTHTSPQLCVPARQPPQSWPEGVQAPLQRTCPAGHIPPHFWSSQVAVPPVMFGQASHDDGPQDRTSLLLTHLFPQR